jgi:hypothetical protein
VTDNHWRHRSTDEQGADVTGDPGQQPTIDGGQDRTSALVHERTGVRGRLHPALLALFVAVPTGLVIAVIAGLGALEIDEAMTEATLLPEAGQAAQTSWARLVGGISATICLALAAAGSAALTYLCRADSVRARFVVPLYLVMVGTAVTAAMHNAVGIQTTPVYGALATALALLAFLAGNDRPRSTP